MKRIFLDHNAGTPLRPQAREALLAWLERTGFGNPSAIHMEGREARQILEEARAQFRAWLGTGTVVFTSGATEANNAALAGWLEGEGAGRLVLASPLEHPSVREVLICAMARGWEIRWAPVARDGALEDGWLEGMLERHGARVGLAVCAAASSEIGRLLPWQEWGKACAGMGVPLHVDATAWFGKLPWPAGARGVSSLALSAVKLGGLPGCGLWAVANGLQLPPFLRGGSQERQWRAGTENVPGILCLLEAAREALLEQEETVRKLSGLRERLWQGLHDLPGVERTVPPQESLPNTLHLRHAQDGELALIRLDLAGVAASRGSACSSGVLRPSPALEAMGWDPDEAARTLRFSLGWSTTEQEVDLAVERIRPILRVRA